MQYTRGLFLDYFVNKGLKLFLPYNALGPLHPFNDSEFFWTCNKELKEAEDELILFFKASQLYSTLPHTSILSLESYRQKNRKI